MPRKRISNFTRSTLTLGTTLSDLTIDYATISEYKYAVCQISSATSFPEISLVYYDSSEKTPTRDAIQIVQLTACVSCSIAVLSETKMIIFYTTTTGDLYAKVATIGDTSLTLGSQSASLYPTGTTHYYNKCVALDASNVVMIGTADVDGNDQVFLGNFNIVGNAINTVGTINYINTNITNGNADMSLSICAIDSTDFAYCYYDDTAVETYANKAVYNEGAGTTTEGNEITMLASAASVTNPQAHIFYLDTTYLGFYSNSGSTAYARRITHTGSDLVENDSTTATGISDWVQSYVAPISDQSFFVFTNSTSETAPSQAVYLENRTSVSELFYTTYTNVNDSVETWHLNKRVMGILKVNSGDMAVMYIDHVGGGAPTYSVKTVILDHWSGLSYLDNNEFTFDVEGSGYTDFGDVEVGKTVSNNFIVQNDSLDYLVVNVTTPDGFLFQDRNGVTTSSGELVVASVEKIIMTESDDYWISDENGNPFKIVE